MAEFTGTLIRLPARTALTWYLGGILLGAIALLTPWCHGDGAELNPITWIDALFTSTSAMCVTGLAVRSTGHDFSTLGQLVILILMQLGGIGIMTVTTNVVLNSDRRLDLSHRLLVLETVGNDPRGELRWVLRRVLILTLAAEMIGAAILTARFATKQPFTEALWSGLFHAVSAFCNCGFGLRDNNLMDYVLDPVVNFTVMSLIVIGGIGFPVLLDLHRSISRPRENRWTHLHLHSKVTLIGSATLILLGTATFLAFEWNHLLRGYPVWERPMIAMFQSVTCRTAGFNTIEIGALTKASLFFSILLMGVGGGACSTAGGFKVSTMMVLLAQAVTSLRGRSRLNIFRRTVPAETVQRAMTAALLFFLVSVMAVMLFLALEPEAKESGGRMSFLNMVFEVVSALGTVGLSTGITPLLNTPQRLLLIVLMVMGRVGPLSIFVAFSQKPKKKQIEYLPEKLFIG